MADYDEDDELTRVLEWLKANGVALAVGAVLGLAIVVGWRWWNAHIDARAMAAAQLYGSVIQQIERGAVTEPVRAKVTRLKQEYTGSPYAANAVFRLAAHAVEQTRYDQALARLDWIVDNSDSVPVRNLARVRKARVLWAAGRADAALALLESRHPETFNRLYAELAGNIHAARGNRAAAHAAYERAAAATDGVAATLQRKLARTAPAEPVAVSTATAAQTTDEGA